MQDVILSSKVFFLQVSPPWLNRYADIYIYIIFFYDVAGDMFQHQIFIYYVLA